MSRRTNHTDPEERRALLGLWSIPGLGPKTLASLRTAAGELGPLCAAALSEWTGLIAFQPAARAALERIRSKWGSQPGALGAVADWTRERAERAGMRIAFAGDPNYPAPLTKVEDAPPLLFHRGEIGPASKRVAMVGSRRPGPGFEDFAGRFAAEVARASVVIVSGAADGVDQACHLGALEVGAETWAFLGSALDQIDPSQARLVPQFESGAGVFFSELPPGVRADRSTFPRRNRLISGSADVVVVLRAGKKSGALHTAEYANAQGRPVLAIPGELANSYAEGCNQLIHDGHAQLCLSAEDVWKAAGAVGAEKRPEGEAKGVDLSELSNDARAAYEVLRRAPVGFEDLLARTRIPSGTLSSALCELELMGLVVQHPGKRYEKV